MIGLRFTNRFDKQACIAAICSAKIASDFLLAAVSKLYNLYLNFDGQSSCKCKANISIS